jgi:hypothetical protein
MRQLKMIKMVVATPSVQATGNPSVPVAQWGRDHWSTFAYLECRAVENMGVIDRERMRCDPKRHPGLANSANRSFAGKVYPTILKDGSEKHDHDDWDCFEDLIEMGFVTWEGSGIHPVVKFTDKGFLMAASLRTHQANGGNFRNFEPGTF